MNMTPEVIRQISLYVNSQGTLNTMTCTQIAAVLNTANIANPVNPAPQIPAPVNFKLLAGALSSASLSKLATYACFQSFLNDLIASNRPNLQAWCTMLTAAGIFTAGDNTTFQAYLISTIADPTWTAQVSWAQLNLGGPVSANDIQQCYPTNSL